MGSGGERERSGIVIVGCPRVACAVNLGHICEDYRLVFAAGGREVEVHLSFAVDGYVMDAVFAFRRVGFAVRAEHAVNKACRDGRIGVGIVTHGKGVEVHRNDAVDGLRAGIAGCLYAAAGDGDGAAAVIIVAAADGRTGFAAVGGYVSAGDGDVAACAALAAADARTVAADAVGCNRAASMLLK